VFGINMNNQNFSAFDDRIGHRFNYNRILADYVSSFDEYKG
jgi:hypothetical protein